LSRFTTEKNISNLAQAKMFRTSSEFFHNP
jgi:hypothetical protein